MKLAVADFGVSIPHSVNYYRLTQKEKPIAPSDCVKWAIKKNKTTKSIPQNAGKGLDLLNTFMKSSGNNWLLYTNDLALRGTPWGNSYNENPIAHFKETIAQIAIQINSLQDKIENAILPGKGYQAILCKEAMHFLNSTA